MKTALVDVIVFTLSFAVLCIAAIFYIPILIFLRIKDAYAEDRENSRMHRRIDLFLNPQREDEYGDYQTNTW